MGNLMLLSVFIAVGAAVVLTILAYRKDYGVDKGTSYPNCVVTLALIAGAIVVLLGFIYLLSPIGGMR